MTESAESAPESGSPAAAASSPPASPPVTEPAEPDRWSTLLHPIAPTQQRTPGRRPRRPPPAPAVPPDRALRSLSRVAKRVRTADKQQQQQKQEQTLEAEKPQRQMPTAAKTNTQRHTPQKTGVASAVVSPPHTRRGRLTLAEIREMTEDLLLRFFGEATAETGHSYDRKHAAKGYTSVLEKWLVLDGRPGQILELQAAEATPGLAELAARLTAAVKRPA